MRNALVLAMTLAASALHAQGSQRAYQSDARLKAPITMRAKIVSLADFTGQLQKLTKVHFDVAPDIADRKMTAIFHDRPVQEVMGAVQSAMFMQWRKAGNGYSLFLPDKAALDEQELIKAENEAIRGGLLEGLKTYAEIAGLSKDEIARREGLIKSQIDALRQDSSPEAQQKLLSLQFQRSAYHSRSGPAICKALGGDLPTIVDSMLTGKTIFGSTRLGTTAVNLPQELLDKVREEHPEGAEVIVAMRYDDAQEALVGRTTMSSSDPHRGTMGFDFFSCHPDLGSPDVQSSKLLATLRKWPEVADSTVLDKVVSAEGPVEASPGFQSFSDSKGFTLAEHLEYIADHANIPVIGDAFRVYCSANQYRTEKTVDDYVLGLRNSKRNARSLQSPPIGYFTANKGWLFVRHESYWRRQLREIPESLLLPLEAIAQTKDFPSTSDYAALAGSLTFDQKSSISMMDSAFKFDPSPLGMAFNSLRLWSTLSADQQSAAQGAGLKLSDISPNQATIVLDGWADKMWDGKLPAPIWDTFLSKRGLVDLTPVLKYQCMDYVAPGIARRPLPPGAIAPKGPREQVLFEYDIDPGMQMNDIYVIGKAHP